MTVRVVDGLEVVDVDEREREWPVITARPLDFREQGVHDDGAVADPREAVDGGGVGRLGQRLGDAVDGLRETPLDPQARGLGANRQVSLGDPFCGAHETAKSPLEEQPRDEGGARGADGGRDEDPRCRVGQRIEGPHERARRDEVGNQEGQGSEQAQSPEKAGHVQSVVAKDARIG